MDFEYADMFLLSLFVIEFDPIVLYLVYMNDIKIQYLIHYHPDSVSCRTLFIFILHYTSLLSLLLSLWQALPSWLIFIRLILANDVELNPEEFSKVFFTFCNWNVNSLAKDNFERVQLLEAHNSLFNYDLISLCEVSINSTVEIPATLLENYTFISKNNPNDSRHGGVGIFYKNTLPLIIRNDLSFNETLVLELRFGKKRIFFTVIYRSPSQNYASTGFDEFLSNFENLFTKIKSENPYSMFFTGDFNGHSQLWWSGGDSTPEGNKIEELTSSLGLSQLINEPTNFEPNKRPTCIDLIFTDQPNLILESGTRSSLDPLCHHQITHCRFNYRIPPPPSFERKIWVYEKANVTQIRKSIAQFPWENHFRGNPDVNWQVDSFTKIILNIMSNFIPNKIIKVVPKDPPWITRDLKSILNRQQRFFRNFKKHGSKPDDKRRVDALRDECKKAIQKAKTDYLKNLGNKLTDPSIHQKSYWKIVNRVMNKCKAPKIPPLVVNNSFLINAKEKAHEFIKYFSSQCTPIENDSTLPDLHFHTDERLSHIPVRNDDILSLIRGLNINKSSGPDEISARMLSLCDESIVLPL